MRRFALLAMAVAAAFLACACAADNTAVRIEPASGDVILAAAQPLPTPGRPDGAAPLSIIRGVQSYGDGYIVYPKVLYCDHAQQINESILAVTAERARQVSGSVFTKYRIEYNRNGLFSLRMELYDLYGDANERLETVYMTYDVATGKLCAIDDLFDGEDERWRGVMPDIITAQAQAKGITLLCDVMPIGDDQQFFINEDEVVLVYELYEIATWSAGEPEFTIPVSQLAEFIPADSPLTKVAAEEGPPADAAGSAGAGGPKDQAEESTRAVAAEGTPAAEAAPAPTPVHGEPAGAGEGDKP